jgi:hypothetical protein
VPRALASRDGRRESAVAPLAPSREARVADDPLASVATAHAGAAEAASTADWWLARRRATVGRWQPLPLDGPGSAGAVDDADAVHAPGGAVLGWLRIDADDRVTWWPATAAPPVAPAAAWRAPLADRATAQRLRDGRPR